MVVPLLFARRVNKYIAQFVGTLPSPTFSTSLTPSNLGASSSSVNLGGGGGLGSSSGSSLNVNAMACTVTEEDMRRALALLAEMAGDPGIMQRDPLDPWSFNRKPEEAKALIQGM